MCGIGIESGDSAISWFHNDNAGTATKVAIPNQVALANNTGYDFAIFWAPSGDVYYWVYDMVQDLVLADSSVSTNLPVTTTGMGWIVAMSNGANTAVGDATLGV